MTDSRDGSMTELAAKLARRWREAEEWERQSCGLSRNVRWSDEKVVAFILSCVTHSIENCGPGSIPTGGRTQADTEFPAA